MKINRKIVLGSFPAVGSLTLIGVGVSTAGPTVTSHTLRFKSVQVSSHNIAHTNRFINADKDQRNGRYVGSDVLEGTLDPHTFAVSTIDSFALKGGFISRIRRRSVTRLEGG